MLTNATFPFGWGQINSGDDEYPFTGASYINFYLLHAIRYI